MSDDDPNVRMIHAIADRLEPRMRARFLAAIEQMKGGVDGERLRQALRAGSIEDVVRALPWDVFQRLFGDDAQLFLRQAIGSAGSRAADELARSLDISFRFDLQNPRAIAWADEHAARLLREVSDRTEQAVRSLVTRAMQGEFSVDQLARQVMRIVGLTEHQALAVTHFEERLIRDGIGGESLARRVERYARAQLRFRATTIARTELITAANQGSQAAWETAAERNLLDEVVTRKVWVATDDERLEAICEALDGQEVGLRERFAGGYLQPPAH